MVNIENDGREIVTSRSGDNNLLSTSCDMSLGLLLRCIETCALENYVNTELTPRAIYSVLLSVDLQCLTVYCDCVSFVVSRNCVLVLTDNAAVTTLSCIVLQKMSEHGRLCQIVDSNNLITLCAKHLTESKTADTTKTIDCNFNCHVKILLYFPLMGIINEIVHKNRTDKILQQNRFYYNQISW